MTEAASTIPDAHPGEPARAWPDELAGLVDRDWAAPRGRQERWVVRGGPGSGKTSLIVDVLRAAVLGGVGLDGVLVLTGSARAGAALLE
ncbi:hypothetical protein, partial [Dietzia aerolata]